MTLFLCCKVSVVFGSKGHYPFSCFLKTCANHPCSLATFLFESNSNSISPSLPSVANNIPSLPPFFLRLLEIQLIALSIPYYNSKGVILVESHFIGSSNWVFSLSKSDSFIGTINKVLACLM